MKIIVVQLSDIHFKTDTQINPDLPSRIAAAIDGHFGHLDRILICFTGDIAFSGKSDEYLVASSFVKRVKLSFEARFQNVPLTIHLIPGNHDCNFAHHTSVRAAVIQSILKQPIEQIDDDQVAECLKVQEEYFQFANELTERNNANLTSKLIDWAIVDHDGYTIQVAAINTAWLSMKVEQQGELRYPPGALNPVGKQADLNISMLHHPYVWLDASVWRPLRSHLEEYSDIILTGHEHETHSSEHKDSTGNITHYLEGCALGGCGKCDIGFNAILFDFEDQSKQTATFKDSLDGFICDGPSQRLPWVRPSTRAKRRHTLHSESLSNLDDLEIGITHSARETLRLKDLYVFPDLRERSVSSDGKSTTTSHISSKDLIQELSRTERVIISGASQAGKSALAKSVCRIYYEAGQVPLLGSADLFKATSIKFREAVANAFLSQYASQSAESFFQLDRTDRILIIDDFHQIRKNNRILLLTLREAEQFFSRIILISDEMFSIGELSMDPELRTQLMTYRHLSIAPFGIALRGELIEKWYSLDSDLSEGDIERTVDKVETLVTTLLGKNQVPATPKNVLLILYALEAGLNASLTLGSYGYCFEMLIEAALSSTVNPVERIDTKRAFLSYYAFHLMSRRVCGIDKSDLLAFVKDYGNRMDIQISGEAMVRELILAGILAEKHELYCFKFPYIYHFYVATFFKMSLYTETYRTELRNRIEEMIEKLYFNDFKQILLLVVYLTRDEQTIELLNAKAQRMFPELSPASLQDDVQFLNDLETAEIPAEVDLQNRRKKKREVQHQLDKIGESHDEEDEDADPENRDAGQIAQAFELIFILGQMLRNAPGWLESSTKRVIMRNAINLGLRLTTSALQFTRQHFSDNGPEMIANMVERKLFANEEKARQFLNWLTETMSMVLVGAVIKSISQSLATDGVRVGFDDLIGDMNTPASKLIEVTTRLDQLDTIPFNEIKVLYDLTKDNRFARRFLLVILVSHFQYHFYPVMSVQKACSIVGIKYNSTIMLPHRG